MIWGFMAFGVTGFLGFRAFGVSHLNETVSFVGELRGIREPERVSFVGETAGFVAFGMN